MDKQKILKKCRNYGVIFALFVVFFSIPKNFRVAIIVPLLFVSYMFFYLFVKNVANYYEDKKLQKMNIISILLLILVAISFFISNDISLDLAIFSGLFLIVIPSFIIFISVCIIFAKLTMRTHLNEFLIFFISAIGFFLNFSQYISIYFEPKYSLITHSVFGIILAIIFLVGVLRFYKKETLHVNHT